jgi:DNA-binding PadR family transcriptional regulator
VRVVSIGYTLLGLLAEGAAHGYDLKRKYDSRFPAAKPLAYGQVYANLARLERDGLVEVAETSHQGGPERTVYALTATGASSLHTWLEQSEPAGPCPADDLVRKTVTALHLGSDAGDFLRRQRTTHLDMMRDLVSLRRDIRDPSARISVDHTIFHLDADLRWLETAAGRADAAQLSHHPAPRSAGLGGDSPDSPSTDQPSTDQRSTDRTERRS